jgi:GTPase SAR1 family protein
MACFSPQEDPQTRQDRELENSLQAERLASLFQFKVLLLGAGETGKSTIIKQIRRIHGHAPSAKELSRTIISLHNNVIDCMKILLYQLDIFEFTLEDPDDLKTAAEVQNFPENKIIDYEMAGHIENLWRHQSIQSTYERRAEFWLLDSCDYYFQHLDRFASRDFVPTERDILMARVRTTGIISHEVLAPNPKASAKLTKDGRGDPLHFTYKVIDVGGQRSERKKWMHQFDDVKCILFLASLAEYSQVCYEDSNKNRMDESLELMEQIAHKKIFASTPIYVLLNKKDLFETVFRTTPLSTKYPSFDGTTTLEGIQFIEQQYINQLPSAKASHYTDQKRPMIFALSGTVKVEVDDAFSHIKNQMMDMNWQRIEETKKEIERERRRRSGTPCAVL